MKTLAQRLQGLAVVFCSFVILQSIAFGQARNSQGEFYPQGDDWNVRVPKPKAPVAFSDYEPASGIEQTRDEQLATLVLRKADQLKSAGEYDAAASLYEKALQRNPKLVLARYQLACNYALSGKGKLAIETFQRACDDGFADYSFAKDDDELGVVRSEPGFSDKLKVIRQRYQSQLENHVGTPVYSTPDSDGAPPLLIMLHGYGDSHENYFDFFESWTTSGFAAVAMPGSLPQLGDAGFIWSTDSVGDTLDQIVNLLESSALKGKFDPKRVFLLGFSQGAMHAVQAAAMAPDRIRGVVAISPGGRPWNRKSGLSLDPPKSDQRIWFIYGAEEAIGPAIQKWSGECRQSGWSVNVTKHDGGHQFPDDWETLQPKIAAFLTK